jgi:parvulin-like peptidyl-prolyl isomerase
MVAHWSVLRSRIARAGRVRGAESLARKRLRRPSVVALALVVAGLPLLWCGSSAPKADEGAVAIRVGPRTATLDELEHAFWDAQLSDTTMRPDTTSLRRFVTGYQEELLEDVLAQEAVPTLDDGPADRLADFRETSVMEALRKAEYGKAYKASDSEIKRAYDLLGRRMRLSYIYVQDRQDANDLMAALREGAAFSKVAAQKSLDPRSRQAGGDIGWATYIELPPQTRDQVFALKPGELAGPFFWNGGYQIFKAEEVADNPARGSLQKERRKLEVGIVAVRVQEAKQKYQDMLLQKYHFKLNPAEVTWLTVLLKEKTATVRRGIPLDEANSMQTVQLGKEGSASKIPWTGSPIPPADTARVVASFDPPDGTVHPELVVEQMMVDIPEAWPTFDSAKDVEKLVHDLVVERLELREALARGLDKDPDVVRAVTRREREIKRRVWTRTFIRPNTRATDEEVQAYYDTHRDEFREPEQRRFVAVNAAHRETAVKAAEALRAGKAPEAIKAELGATDTTVVATTSQGTDLLTNGKSPMLDPVIFSLPLNGVSDPIPVGQTFTVAKVIQIVPAKEDAPEDAKESIRAKLSAPRIQGYRQQLMDEARAKYPAEVHWDVVRKVPLQRPES